MDSISVIAIKQIISNRPKLALSKIYNNGLITVQQEEKQERESEKTVDGNTFFRWYCLSFPAA